MLINSVLRRIWVTFQLSCLISVVGKVAAKGFLEAFLMYVASFGGNQANFDSREDESARRAETSLGFSKKLFAIFRLREVRSVRKKNIARY